MRKTLICPDERTLLGVLHDTLSDHEQCKWTDHLSDCSDCQRRLESLGGAHIAPRDLSLADARPVDATPELRLAIQRMQSLGIQKRFGSEATTLSLDYLRPSDQPELLGTFGKFEVLEVVGKGGMGVVFKANDPSLERTVAIKLLTPQLARQTTARQRFLREARAAAAVEHDNIVPIYAVDESDGLPYLEMQMVKGQSLEQRIELLGALPVEEIVRIGSQIATGLAAAHDHGLIHRDIKPANILIESLTGRTKITDFGLARAVNDIRLTSVGTLIGTPQYMAPEQGRLEEIDHRADLFALGSLLYAMCTGEPPFKGDTPLTILREVCDSEPTPIRELNRDIPEWLSDVVTKLMAKAPADRFQSATDVVEKLRQTNQDQTEPSGIRRKGWPLAVTTAFVVLLVIVGGIAIGTTQWWSDGRKANIGDLENPMAESSVGFFVLGQEVTLANLADAVEYAQDGDVIVVNGNGPFDTDSISLVDKSLTIRAGLGFHPVIRSRTFGGNRTRALFRIRARLVLEGLDIQGFGEAHKAEDVLQAPEDVLQSCSVSVDGGTLRAANCRFVVGPGHCCIGISSGQCELQNCQLVAHNGFGMLYYATDAGLICYNSIVVAQTGIGVLADNPRQNWPSREIQLKQSTWVTNSLLHLIDSGRTVTRKLPTRGGRPNLHVNVENNLISTSTILKVRPDTTRAERLHTKSVDAKTLVRRGLDWQETFNVYSKPTRFLAWSTPSRGTSTRAPLLSLEEWKLFWEQTESSSVLGIIKFQAIGIPNDAEYYRIQSIQSESESIADNLGANVSLVGPGKAYAEWQQTGGLEKSSSAPRK